MVSTKFPIKTVYFLGSEGLTTSSYTVYDYTTIGNMDLWNIYVLYIQYICISIQYTYISGAWGGIVVKALRY